ncbi:hypothetical protein RHS01_09396 [Rhizoctonia solani]|uniref:WW domain-containing protein n=1 Tax=Rhizoctonia solani TaxID=456999 RepID=A0A8H7M3J1_9AGAM|nr:hypothetical protein RHS01_09396 [Rhizoctonia solani]
MTIPRLTFIWSSAGFVAAFVPYLGLETHRLDQEEELDWGDAVDVVSLGDEDEIPCLAAVDENIGEETAPIPLAHEDDFEYAAISIKSQAPMAHSHPLGLSHLPPKPQSVSSHRRSRETIKASSMSRPYVRTHSPSGALDDLPRPWEVRRTETIVYYYNTEFRCSQLKRPTRDDAGLDKFNWPGDAPPSASDRSQSARNPPPGPAEWPERSVSDHHRSSTRDRSPPPRRSSPAPRQRSPKPSRQRSGSIQQPPPARALSPSSMLIPRRGQSPARGLAKSSKQQRTDSDLGVSSDPQDSRLGRSRDSGWEPRGRNNARERDMARNSGRMDHYSPPPDNHDSPPQRGSRNRSISPPRKMTAMRSDAMIINQRGSLLLFLVVDLLLTFDSLFHRAGLITDVRRSLSPREREDARVMIDLRLNGLPVRRKRYPESDLRQVGGDYSDLREDFRARDARVPNPGPHFVPAPDVVPRDTNFPPRAEDEGFPAPTGFMGARYSGRPDNRRSHSSRSTNLQVSRVELQENELGLSPPLRNDVALSPRRDFIHPRDVTSAHHRPRNGDTRERMIGGDRDSMALAPEAGPVEHSSISPLPERNIRTNMHQANHSRRHGRRPSIPQEDFMAPRPISPRLIRERPLSNVNPPGYSGRPHEFPQQDVPEPRTPISARGISIGTHQKSIESNASNASLTLAAYVWRSQCPMPMKSHPALTPVALQLTMPRRLPRPEFIPRQNYSDMNHFPLPVRPTPAIILEMANLLIVPRVPGIMRLKHRTHMKNYETAEIYNRIPVEARERRATGSSRFDKPETEPRSNYNKRRPMRDDARPYEPDDRQWTPREAPPPLPRARSRSPPAQMELDSAPPGSAPEEQLSGWAGFHRRRERSQERRESSHSYRPRINTRDSWHPSTDADNMEVEAVEGGKRQRVEGGTRTTQLFNRREEDLPRKVPHHSPEHRPKVHSPVSSFSKLPTPAVVSQSVNIEAAMNRVRDIASQINQANPQLKSRPKSRFGQASDSNNARESETSSGFLIPSGPPGVFGPANVPDNTVLPETNERSSPEDVNDGRQGSEGSQSSHIVSRMDEASLRDNTHPQRHAGRQRDSRPDANSFKRDRNRSDNYRNGGRNNSEKSPRFVDSYRPGDENPGRGGGGMRAWDKPEQESQRDLPPHTSSQLTNRTYRNAGDRPFARPPRVLLPTPEGLPPRPLSPTEFPRGAGNRGQTAGQAHSPTGQGSRPSVNINTEVADATTDDDVEQTPTTGFSFLTASAGTPRKFSLLDRMTDPTSGAPLTVPAKDRGNNSNGDEKNHRMDGQVLRYGQARGPPLLSYFVSSPESLTGVIPNAP